MDNILKLVSVYYFTVGIIHYFLHNYAFKTANILSLNNESKSDFQILITGIGLRDFSISIIILSIIKIINIYQSIFILGILYLSTPLVTKYIHKIKTKSKFPGKHAVKILGIIFIIMSIFHWKKIF